MRPIVAALLFISIMAILTPLFHGAVEESYNEFEVSTPLAGSAGPVYLPRGEGSQVNKIPGFLFSSDARVALSFFWSAIIAIVIVGLLGFATREPFRRKGYAAEVLGACVDALHRMGRTALAECPFDSIPAVRTLQNARMMKYGDLLWIEDSGL